MAVLLALIAVAGGLALLTYGADRLIVAAVAIARRLRLPEAVIGATIVAGGTSMPELVASVSGALGGQYGLAVGNVVGSNIFNVGVILALVALVAPLQVAPGIARFDWPFMAAVSAACGAIALVAGVFPQWACCLFLAVWLGYIIWSVRSGHGTEEAAEEPAVARSPAMIALSLVAGIAMLSGGGWLLVWGSVDLARSAGISDAIIGLTIVAAGTSAPELVTSLMAAKRGQHQIAVANIVGSNTFNILLILGLTGLFGTLPVADEILHRDLWWMVGISLLLPLAWGFGRRLIGRLGGGLLLAGYLVYLAILLRAVLAPTG
ncbi:MAG: calcium/sodium antiporter [Planctomycetes bacterium]|nr:calcium/sodium antiporter [Planctomycetota bacterium]